MFHEEKGTQKLQKSIAQKLRQKRLSGNKIGLLKRMREQCDKEIERIVDEMNRERRTLLAQRNLSAEVLDLREKIVFLTEKERSEDSTRREIRDAGEDKRMIIARLQKICSHDFLIGYSGYEGSYSHDRDDAYPGKRMCVVCGFTEKEKGVANQSDVYEHLSGGNWRFRFFSSDVYGFSGKVGSENCDKLLEPSSDRLVVSISENVFHTFNIWRPFEELRSLFQNV